MGKNDICKKTYETLCALYDKGTRVEAISVAGVNDGSKGTVLRVRRNGDMEVEFDRYGTVLINYPDEVVRVVHMGSGCILKMKHDGVKAECRDDCKKCGWNPKVDKKRKEAIANGEMVKRHGVRHLVLSEQ